MTDGLAKMIPTASAAVFMGSLSEFSSYAIMCTRLKVLPLTRLALRQSQEKTQQFPHLQLN